MRKENPSCISCAWRGIDGEYCPELLEARKRIGSIRAGESAITPGFGLDAKYVIHTVGPIYEDGKQGEKELLSSCYRES